MCFTKPSGGSGTTGFYLSNPSPEPIIRVLQESKPNPTRNGLRVHPLGLGSVGFGRVDRVFYPLDTPN